MTALHPTAFAGARPVPGLSPLDLAEHDRFVADHHARKAAIYDASEADRAAMTRKLERDTAAYSRGADLSLAPVTVVSPHVVAA